MQRSNKSRFKKVGGGPLTLRGGKVIQSGQIFRAAEDEIPQAFGDLVEQLDPKPSREEEAAPPQTNLEIRHKGGGWYDLINTQTDQAINTTSMRQDEAKQLAKMAPEEAEAQVQKKEAVEADEGQDYDSEDEGNE